MDPVDKNVPNGFTSPTALPSGPEQQRFWQDANRAWWQRNPMRYDWSKKIGRPEFSKEFYEEIDRRFFAAASEYLPWKTIPFDRLIDFAGLQDKDVLEVGVGNGSHAALLARHAKSFTGIDLTDYAVKSTSARFKCFNLAGTVCQMDAERMSFSDRTFDFVWSWGVIHHSSDTRQILSEIARVLRPDGRAVTMVYHRNAWNYYMIGGVVHGLLRGRLFKAGTLHQVVQLQTDGAIARYYSEPEWSALAAEFLDVDGVQVHGSKSELLPLPSGRLKSAAAALIPGPVARFFTHTCKLGSFLVSSLSSRP
jgi:ubiquinone/menaquinone biosynthesis C-methylase UbiE